MRVPGLKVERSFLNSRVARRVFWSVSIPSLLPIAVFALFSLFQVRGQLELDAANSLRSNLKESGVAIIGRLRLADESLKLRIRGGSRDEASDAPSILRTVSTTETGDLALSPMVARKAAKLSEGQRTVVVDEQPGEPRVLLLRTAGSRPIAWIAELDPDFLFESERYSERDRFEVRDAGGSLIFSAGGTGDPEPTAMVAPALSGVSVARADGFLTVSRLLPLPGNDRAGDEWVLSVGRSIADIQRPLREFEAIFPWVVGITLFVALGLALGQTRRILVPIEALTAGAGRIRGGDFTEPVEVQTDDEFGTLAESFNRMTASIDEHIRVLHTTNEIGAALSAESSSARLIELILAGSMEVTGGTAAVMFLLDDAAELQLAQAIVGGEQVRDQGSSFAMEGREIAAHCLARRTTLRTDHREDRETPDKDAWTRIEEQLGAGVSGSLVVPMSTEKNEPIGAVLLWRTDAEAFSDENAALASSLVSQAAVAVRKNRLVESFRSLFEGVVDLTVRAIDEKSAYTGDHCRKVPILTEMIADAACGAVTGPLKDFDLTPDERYELKIAALLHDCGKVVTPVHVMDKATKLEAISDRIEVIETRFELVRANEHLRAHQSQPVPSRGDLSPALERELADELALLDQDLEFIKICNLGGERMADEDCERIREIASSRVWIDREGQAHGVLDADDVANLTIRRGTLNNAERDIIQEHVTLTIQMLDALPWPNELRGVPAIAGAHHERVDGGGYPLGLRESQLSVQARILALADVFEALTAKSRPYKPGKTLSETLGILDHMSSEGHIDVGLYELFLEEQLHLKYSIEHVAPGQIDGAHQAMVERLTNPADAPGGGSATS